MQGSLGFAFACSDRCDRLDPRVWKAIVTRSLARSGEGLAVCDAELDVLFATPLAVHLLGRLGAEPQRALPEKVARLVNEQLNAPDVFRTDRVSALRGGAVLLHAGAIQGIPPARVAILLREEVLRDDGLFARLKEEYSISPRGFRLAQLVRRGLTNRQIAEELHLTESTVKVYLHHLYRDCRVSSRTALIALLDRSSR